MTPSKPNFSSSRRFSSTFVRRSRSAGGRLLGDGPQLVDVERLEQVVERPLLHGRDGRGDRAVAGDQDHLGVGQVVLGRAQNLQAVDVVHHQVGDDDVELLLRELLEPLGSRGRRRAGKADPLQAVGHGQGVRLIVVDNQHAARGFRNFGERRKRRRLRPWQT